MNELVIDVTRLVDRLLQGRLHTGVDRVTLAYIDHFRTRSRALLRFAGRWIVSDGHDSQRIFDAVLAPEANFSRVARWHVARGYAVSWRRPRARSILLNTGHSGLDHPSYARRVRSLNLRPLFFLHDLIPITHPEYCRAGEAERHHRRLATMLSVGHGLVVNSLATKSALEDYAAKLGRQVPPCVIAPLAPARLPRPGADRPLPQPYFVVLGTIEPRKNHLLLLHLWRQLADELGEAAPRLVVIGQRGWECEQAVDLLERCSQLRGFVIEIPRCEDANLATWLHHARALLFPSFAEGFGIPLVEALSLGVPAIASDLAPFREVAGDVPEYLDPLDGPEWKRAIVEYSEMESPARQAQCRRMTNFRAPTWDTHWGTVENFLDQVYGEA